MYKLMRHGGNTNHKWKCLLETESEDEALKMYEKEREKMRQGRIILEKDGEIIKSDWAPRIRYHW